MDSQGDDVRKTDQRLQEVAQTVREARKALDAAASPKAEQAREASKKVSSTRSEQAREVPKVARLADGSAYKVRHIVPLHRDLDPANVNTWPIVEEVEFSNERRRAGAPSGSFLPTHAVAERPARKARPAPAGEAVVRRAAREQRKEIVAFFEASGLEHEVKELSAVERRLRDSSERDLRHGAFSARTLLQAVADQLFPARTEYWTDSKGEKHKVGTEEVGNRLSAYVEIHLFPALEPAERRAFQGELDGLMRWTGSGPHGANGVSEADLAFTRLLSVLTIVGRAHRRTITARAA